MLILPIKKKWFDMIKSGEKKEEYREIKPYYDTRIGNALLGFPLQFYSKELVERKMKEETIEVLFRNGYGIDAPEIWCRCRLRIGQGKEEWGAEPGKEYYILEILEVLK